MRIEQTAFDGGGGTALGTRATVRAGVRYSKADGHSVGPLNYGSRDSGGAYDTKDLSAHTTVTHAIGSRFTGTGTFNYFRYESVSADRVVDPPYSTFAILAGTPNALVSERDASRAAGRSSRVQPAGRRRGVAGAGTVSRLASEQRFHVQQPDGIPAPGRKVSRRLHLGVGPALERRLRLGTRDQSQCRRLRSRQQRLLPPAADHHRRSLVRNGRRSRRQQGKLQHVRQPEAVGRRLPRAGAARRALLREAVRQHRPRA